MRMHRVFGRALRAGLLMATVLAAALGVAAQAAERSFESQAEGRYREPARAAHFEGVAQSNRVNTQLGARPASINFFADETFAARANVGALGRRLFVQAVADGCNTSERADEVQAMLYSEQLQQGTPLTLTETGASTGVFRSAAPLMAAAGSVTATDDRLWVMLGGCAGAELRSAVNIEPVGTVFDSESGQPLAGARVTLFDMGGTSAPAAARVARTTASGDDEVLSTTTDTEGRYRFAALPPAGRYRLVVQPAEGWVFPSQAAAAALRAQHSIHSQASYGHTFEVTSWGADALPDVPVDPLSRVLRVQLSVSRSQPEIAESLVYTAQVRNAGDSMLDGLVLAGTLPPGLAYLPGSVRVNGQPLAPAADSGRGPALRFVLPRMEAGATLTLGYRVVVGAAALQGDGLHRIQARAALPLPTLSNVASVKVEVQPGVFTAQALLLGTVFADCNANGRQDAGEPGAPGVRLLLQDGSYAITDAQGHYSFYGLRPRTQVLKIDALSLPAGVQPLASTQRHAGDGHSRFVDPRRGQLVRADFALQGCGPAQREAWAQRAARLRPDRELQLSTQTELTPDGATRALGDRRALQASGVIGERVDAKAPPPKAPAGGTPARASPSASPSAPEAPAEADDDTTLEALAPQVDAQLGFIDLKDGQAVSGGPLLLRVKGRADSRYTLWVNGSAIGEDRIGQRVVVPQTQAELREYVGVPLRAGRNTLQLLAQDGFGNTRAQYSVTVLAPGALAQLRLQLPEGSAPSDGETLVPVTVELLDGEGQRIGGRTALTLHTSLGQWALQDNDPLTPGVQTFVEGGLAKLALRAPASAGEAQLSAEAGPARAQATLRFAPALRPLVAVGLVEGVLQLRHLKPGPRATTPQDGFDTALQGAAQPSGQDKTGTRAAAFLKGKVGDDTLLTVGYESDKDRRERLFRDIQPDAFYPVYGDDAVKGYDAQSTSRLYARAERGTASALYGDFSTQSSNPLRQLGAYQRSLTGARLTQAGGAFTGNVWASRDTTRQQVVEQRGNGTSGPFDLGSLGTLGALANSERVEVLVRNRDQPATVLRTTPLQRYADYDFDAFSGLLLLRSPLPSSDSELNPVSVRVTVEVDQGGPAFWVAGADGQLKINDTVQIGGAFVQDRNPLEPLQLASANASLRLAAGTALVAEAARSTRADGLVAAGAGRGDAQRLELVHEGTALRVRAHVARSDANFSNPSASLGAGREEAGLKGDYRLDDRTRLLGEALHSADAASGRRRSGALLGWERSYEGGVKAEFGLRHVSGPGSADGADGARETTTAARAKLGAVVPALPAASVFVEAEQDLRDSGRRMAAVGGDLQLAAAGRLYLRHEFISSMSGPYALDAEARRNSTLLGIDAAAPYDGRAFGEYRLHEGLSGREAEAALGLRNKWALAEGLRLNTSFERVQALQGSQATPSGAATAALEYTRDTAFKASTRLELRRSSTERSLLATLAAAWKLGSDWTLLGRAAEARLQSRSAAQPERSQQRLQLGLAYRDGLRNRANGLARYEFKRETGPGQLDAEGSGARAVHVVSSHGDWQPTSALTVSGQLAAKWVQERDGSGPLHSQARLAGARITHDLGERWDVGAHAHLLSGGGSRARSVGVEGGYRVQTNLWLSVGWNAQGFRDRDLGVQQHTERGAYLRLRFKFDENLLK